ncbi:hypothetical protein [Clostridium omnivorum]|uniref:hypothetical protein n=1 Tax=Clostridium omnivorum TaxID=1604902 RepID=UPI00222F604F|nr:hypothetical protein [Clostridium sp. E14]
MKNPLSFYDIIQTMLLVLTSYIAIWIISSLYFINQLLVNVQNINISSFLLTFILLTTFIPAFLAIHEEMHK